ncbi:MAG: DUF1059 domain-containing protein [Myxococcaceae bacterium]
MARKVSDCRDMPSVTGCTLTISGEEEEVLRAALEHAISVHGEEDSAELRRDIRASLKDEDGYYGPRAPYAEGPTPSH